MFLNVIQVSFLVVTFLVVFLGLLIQQLEGILHPSIAQLYRYGKMSYNGPSKFYTVRVPKRWFRHFYVFSLLFSTYMLFWVVNVVLLRLPPPESMLKMFDWLHSKDRADTVSPTTTLVAMVLLTLQCWKRFYETHFISIYSNSYMDIGHYFLGYLHYFGAIVSLVIETPGFTRNSIETNFNLKFEPFHFVFGSIFLLAWYKQLESAQILASLRTNKKGQIVTQKHLMPVGGLFDKISCPHLSCEILMYLCLTAMLWTNYTWWCITFWVVSNQVSVAIFTHQWYKSVFKDYPKQRRMVIPYVW